MKPEDEIPTKHGGIDNNPAKIAYVSMLEVAPNCSHAMIGNATMTSVRQVAAAINDATRRQGVVSSESAYVSAVTGRAAIIAIPIRIQAQNPISGR